MKTCGRCKESQTPSEFHKSNSTRDGLHTICKTCRIARTLAWRDETGRSGSEVQAIRARYKMLAALQDQGKFRCPECEEVKPVAQFSPNGYRTNGEPYYGRCKPCTTASTKRWSRANPEKYKASRWRQNERRRGALVDVPETHKYVEILRGDPCAYCGAAGAHVDHIVPVAAGGMTEWENLTHACRDCNYSKRARPLLLWMATRRACHSGVVPSFP